jgi:hypothetical protein
MKPGSISPSDLRSNNFSHTQIKLRNNELILETASKGGFPTPDSPPSPPPPPVRVALYADDKIVALDEPMKDDLGEFLRDATGRIVWLRFGGRIHARK